MKPTPEMIKAAEEAYLKNLGIEAIVQAALDAIGEVYIRSATSYHSCDCCGCYEVIQLFAACGKATGNWHYNSHTGGRTFDPHSDTDTTVKVLEFLGFKVTVEEI